MTPADHLALAQRLVPWRKVPHHLIDDARSEAVLGLLRCLPRYDPRKGTLPQFAALRVRGAVRDFLRTQMPLGYRRKERLKPGDVVPRVRTLGVELGRFEG